MGMQVSCGVDSEVSEEEFVWGVAKVSGINIPRARRAKRESGDEGHLLPDHVHMLTSIPPKYAIAQYMGRKKNFTAGILGHAGILCRPLERMKRPSASISGDRNRKIVAWIK